MERGNYLSEAPFWGVGPDDSFDVIEDRRAAIRRAVEMAREGDVVLVAGKGHETFQEFAHQTVPFDDRKVVEEILGSCEL